MILGSDGGVIVLLLQLLAGIGGAWLGARNGSRTPSQPAASATAEEMHEALLPAPAEARISRRTLLQGGAALAVAGGWLYGQTLLRRDIPALTYLGHHYVVYGVAWSPDGTRIVSGDYMGNIHLWNPLTGARFATGQTGNLSFSTPSLSWSPDGKRLVCGNDDGSAQVLDGKTLDEITTFQSDARVVNPVAWSPDGQSIAIGYGWFGGSAVRVWNPDTNQILLSFGGVVGFSTLAWSPAGKRLVADANEHDAQVWDASTGQILLTYEGHTDSVYSVAWSPDGKRIASGSRDTTIQVWDAETGKHLFTCLGQNEFVQGLAWSPDGRYLLSGGWGAKLLIWDGSSGSLINIFQADGLLTWYEQLWGDGGTYSVSWSPDGTHFVSGGDGGARIWRVR